MFDSPVKHLIFTSCRFSADLIISISPSAVSDYLLKKMSGSYSGMLGVIHGYFSTLFCPFSDVFAAIYGCVAER